MNGWGLVGLTVVGYDTWAAATGAPTLSAQFKGAAGRRPWLCGAVTGYLVLHLWGRWPRRADPFCLFCREVARLTH